VKTETPAWLAEARRDLGAQIEQAREEHRRLSGLASETGGRIERLCSALEEIEKIAGELPSRATS